MKKSILNLAGAQELSRKELKNISGGNYICSPDEPIVVCARQRNCQFNGTNWYCA